MSAPNKATTQSKADKICIWIHRSRYSGYSTAPVVNCSVGNPNIGKGCTDPPVQCGNARCAMQNQAGYWAGLGLDWLAAGGTKQEV